MGDVHAGAALPDGGDLALSALSEFEFEEVATKVEERFSRVYSVAGKSDVYTERSEGWWLVIKRINLALWIGKDKPTIESGDLLTISIRKRVR